MKRPPSFTTKASSIHGLKWKSILCSGDQFMQTVKLEGAYTDRSRYLCIVNHGEEFCLLGVDEEVDTEAHKVVATIGLVSKMSRGLNVTLDGDGGFTYHRLDKQFIFKPVSVQALWTVIQTLHMIAERLMPVTSTSGSNEDDWIKQYEVKVASPQSCINEWHMMADLLVRRPPSPHRTPQMKRGVGGQLQSLEASLNFETVIKSRLRQIMKTSNLDTITSKKIRKQLEGDLRQSLEEYKSFIDKEILVILGQMDPASRILDYLYLGSEWNASNLEELHANRITHILNVTREIDNFFPADFKYKNIRVYDEEATDLLRYFDETNKFIKEAKEAEGKVLVHCKMGISRSATCTISFMMKEYNKDLASGLIQAKERRSIVNPNKGFIKQLEVYEGILGAIRNRQNYHNGLFRSKSESSLPNVDNAACGGGNKKVGVGNSPAKSTSPMKGAAVDVPDHHRLAKPSEMVRPKSWSPNDKVAHFLLDQADRLSKSATADNVIDDCGCFEQLNLQISEFVPYSPVNSLSATIVHHCECNVELELSVPTEPVQVGDRGNDDLQTDVIVQSLSQLPIQMRTSGLLEDFRSSSHGGSVSSSVSSTASVPTTPIFVLKRRSSVDSAFLAGPTPTPPPLPPPPPPPFKSEVLSVKTLANMFDFKVTSIPLRPCSARLEDNHIFQRMAKQLDDNETDC